MSNKHLLQKKWFLISWLNPILYVDDLLFINNDTNKLEWLTSQLMKEYEITNPGQMWIYNIKFIHLPIILFIMQQLYIQKMFNRFRLIDWNGFT
jgi:hypothetical protein